MENLFKVLDKIKKAPGMYLARPSVSDLFMFLVGYEFARREMGQNLTPKEESFYENWSFF